MTPADEFRKVSMGWLWGIVAVTVPVFSGLLTPWDAINATDSANKDMVASVAGYTFPLTLGFGILSFLFLKGAHRGASGINVLAVSAIILFVCALVADELGLGKPPDLKGTHGLTGVPWPFMLLSWIFRAYFNVYRLGLMVSSLVIGFVGAVQIERWLHGKSQS